MFIEALTRNNPWWSNPAARAVPHLPGRRIAEGIVRTRVLDLGRRRAMVVVGPRQVGKSVLLKQVADDLLNMGWPPGNVTLIDFSDPLVEVDPPTLQQVVDFLPRGIQTDQPRAFLFDEVTQSGDAPVGKPGDWSRALKHLVDASEPRQHRFVATDSSAAVLRGGTRESGVGRWDELQLGTFDYREYLGLISLPGEATESVVKRVPGRVDRFLLTGGFPRFANRTELFEAQEDLRSDIEAKAIFKDLKRTGLDLARVRSLFVYLMEDSGAQFDPATRRRWLTQLGGGEPVDQRSLLAWVDALEDTMLVVRLMPHGASHAARLRERAYPKLYAADSSLVAAFSMSRHPLEEAAAHGRILEAAVFRHLRGLGGEHEAPCTYGRSKAGSAEIDFIVTTQKRRIGVEVKATVGRADPANVERATSALKLDRGVVIHAGPQTQQLGKVTLLALEDFLLSPEQLYEDRP